MPGITPDRLEATDTQPAMKLTLEVQTPWTRWLLVAVITIAAFSALAWAINSGNPKRQASDLVRIAEAHPTPPPALPTATTEPGVYTATLEIDPLEPKTPNGIITLTSTLIRDDKPVEGAKVHLTLGYWEGVRDVDGGVTGPDGTAVLVYNIHRARGDWGVRVVSAFFIDDKIVVRADNEFLPEP